MKKGHKASECRSKDRCKNCNGGYHHTSICDKQVVEELPAVEQTSSKIVVQEATATSVHASSGAKIALQTAQGYVTADNSKSIKCRIMFDSGSQRSYITTELANMLNSTPKKVEWLQIQGFGKQGATVRGRVFDVKVESLNKNNPIYLDIIEVPTIAKFQNVHVEIVKDKYKHLKDLQFSDVTDKGTLEVHMLIGADNLWQFQSGEVRKGEINQPVAIETTLGWTISGKIDGEQEISGYTQSTIVIEPMKRSTESDLSKLWDLETLDIRERNEVYDDLIDNITFNGNRYSVKLPWKAGHAELPDHR